MMAMYGDKMKKKKKKLKKKQKDAIDLHQDGSSSSNFSLDSEYTNDCQVNTLSAISGSLFILHE